MTTTTMERTDPGRLARTIGFLYLTLFVVGPIAFLFGKAELVTDGDAAATAADIADNTGMFRLGMTAEATVFIIEIVAAAMLYFLFRHVSRHMSMAAMLARFGQAVIQGVNLLWSSLALTLVGGAAYLEVFDDGQRDGLTQLFMDTNGFMVHVWGIFFGVHLAILGWLVIRSRFLPSWLGYLLAIASVGYLMEGFGAIVAPGAADLLAVLVIVLSVPGELAFTGWLLFKKVDVEAWRAQVAAG